MAQGNLIQGQSSGKLGDVVLMVRKGKQVARVYTTSGARSGDAASEAARYQRVRFGAAANQWDLYKYVCTRMYRKGIKTNQSDYNYFVKKNIAYLPFLTKEENANGVHVVMPGQFSEGNLGRIELLTSFGKKGEADTDVMYLYDLTQTSDKNVRYGDTVSKLKETLASIYKNATKCTYLIMSTSNIEIESSGTISESQYVTYYTITIELLKETVTGENSMKVSEFFAREIKNPSIASLFSGDTNSMMYGSGCVIIAQASTEEQKNTLKSIGMLFFATNDNVSDCYTTILPVENVPDEGVFKAFYGYRTMEALTVAAQSYGYQTGVMRDNIAQVSDTSEQTINTYVQKLSTVDAAAAASLQAEIADAGASVIKSSRKKIEPTEQA